MALLDRSYLPLLLTVVAAGLGHFSLGHWRRGILWLGLYLFTLVFLSSYTPLLVGGDTIAPFIYSVLDGRLDPAGAVFPLSVLALCLVDVRIIQRSGDRRGGDPE